MNYNNLNVEKKYHEREARKRLFAVIRRVIHSFLKMNRYFLVVSPGLERLLYQEIQDYLPRLRTNPTKVYFTTGGIELDCILFVL